MNDDEVTQLGDLHSEMKKLRKDVASTYSKTLNDRLESLDKQISDLRDDMREDAKATREDITRLENRIGSGFTKLQWWLIGILGTVVIGLLALILQSMG